MRIDNHLIFDDLKDAITYLGECHMHFLETFENAPEKLKYKVLKTIIFDTAIKIFKYRARELIFNNAFANNLLSKERIKEVSSFEYQKKQEQIDKACEFYNKYREKFTDEDLERFAESKNPKPVYEMYSPNYLNM